MTRTDTVTFSQTDDYTLNYLPVNHGLCVFEITVISTITTTNTKGTAKTKQETNIISGFQREDYLKKTKPKNIQKLSSINEKYLQLVDNSFFDSVKNTPLHKILDATWGGLSNNPYQDFVKSNGALSIILFKRSSHTFFMGDETIIPTMIYFDYMHGSIDNFNYDLDKALPILKNNQNIIFLRDGVQEIAYYNASRSRNITLEFNWYTDSIEDFSAMRLATRNFDEKTVAKLLQIENCITSAEYRELKEQEDEDSDYRHCY